MISNLRDKIPKLENLTHRMIDIGLKVSAGLLLLIVVVISISSNNLPDMTSFDAGNERKSAFLDYLTPIIETGNLVIEENRQWLLEISDELTRGESPSFFDNRRIHSLADQFLIESEDVEPTSVVNQLLLRVDSFPVELVLVQAAKESGWGTSNFARKGNNLFGQWCYQKGCGIVPSKRNDDAVHEVQVFNSVDDAVAAYLHNLNTGKAYRQLRDIRSQLRSAGKTPDAVSLADGLLLYSERRQAYVDEVKLMIHQNRKFQTDRDR
jgi:Bax protein